MSFAVTAFDAFVHGQNIFSNFLQQKQWSAAQLVSLFAFWASKVYPKHAAKLAELQSAMDKVKTFSIVAGFPWACNCVRISRRNYVAACNSNNPQDSKGQSIGQLTKEQKEALHTYLLSVSHMVGCLEDVAKFTHRFITPLSKEVIGRLGGLSFAAIAFSGGLETMDYVSNMSTQKKPVTLQQYVNLGSRVSIFAVGVIGFTTWMGVWLPGNPAWLAAAASTSELFMRMGGYFIEKW
jgi:hypothetical protein